MKRFLALLLLSMAAVPSLVRATPVTVSFNFKFDQNTSHPSETPVIGTVTISLNTPGVSGYTTNGTVDAFSFNIPGLGLEAASTNYVKMLFDASGHMTYLLVSDRNDFALSAIPPRQAGYILGLTGTDLLTGTGITIGSNGSYFDYYLNGRTGIDIAYTFTTGNVAKVANPSAVPETSSTLALLGVAMLGLVGLRPRFLA